MPTTVQHGDIGHIDWPHGHVPRSSVRTLSHSEHELWHSNDTASYRSQSPRHDVDIATCPTCCVCLSVCVCWAYPPSLNALYEPHSWHTGWAKNVRPQTHGRNSVKSEPIFWHFITVRFPNKFAVKRLLWVPPCLAYVASLPCENVNVRKLAINDTLQNKVSIYFRFGGVVNDQIK